MVEVDRILNEQRDFMLFRAREARWVDEHLDSGSVAQRPTRVYDWVDQRCLTQEKTAGKIRRGKIRRKMSSVGRESGNFGMGHPKFQPGTFVPGSRFANRASFDANRAMCPVCPVLEWPLPCQLFHCAFIVDPVWPSMTQRLSLSLSLSLCLSHSLTLSLSLSLSLSFTLFFLLLLFGPSRPLLCAVGILRVDSCLLNLSYNKQTFPTELNWTEKGESVRERESRSTCVTPGERLRQSLGKQTKNEVGRRGIDGKEMQKKISARSTPWKRNSWFLSFDCPWTWWKLGVRACRRPRSPRQLWIRVRELGSNHEPVANFWPWIVSQSEPLP